MATRQQQRGSQAVQYEDFQPKSEWKEEPAANILMIHLPGFSKEQMKVTYVHSSRTIRVTGERPLEATGNIKRWSRFNLAFSVPQNCIVGKIHGSFKNGILTVNLPKQTITKVTATTTSTAAPKEPEKENAPKMQATSQQDAEALPGPRDSEIREETNKIEKPLPPPTVSENVQQKNQRDEKLSTAGITSPLPPKPAATVTTTESKDHEKLHKDSHLKPISEIQKDTEKGERVPAPTTTMTTAEPKDHVKVPNDSHQSISEIEKETEMKKMIPPLVFPAEQGEKESRKRESEKAFVLKKEKKGKGVMDMATDVVKKIKGMELNEERLLMVNMGVAALVIFALGAYVSYTFTSSSSSSSSGGRTRD